MRAVLLFSLLSYLLFAKNFEALEDKFKNLVLNTSCKNVINLKKDYVLNLSLLESFKIVKHNACLFAKTKNEKEKALLRQSISKELLVLNKRYENNHLKNWWVSMIGIPKQINQICVLIKLKPSLLKTLLKTQANFASFKNKRKLKAANLSDLAYISFVRGILLKDEKELKASLDVVKTLFKLRVKGLGFYADGGYLQHANVPYNGTYGEVYLNSLAKLLYINSKVYKENEALIKAALKGYGYFFFEGGVNDSVSGRAISRVRTSPFTRGKSVLNTLFLLSLSSSKPLKSKLKDFIYTQYLQNKAFAKNDYLFLNPFFAKNFKGEVKQKESKRYINSVKRLVYKTPNFSVLLSLCGEKVSCFESMNGENTRGWEMSKGMVYLYDGEAKTWQDYFYKMDYKHLSGTTSLQYSLSLKKERKLLKKERLEVDGLCFKEACLASFTQKSKRLSFKKTWVFYKSFMIAIGSNISSNEPYEVHTTLKNRPLYSLKLVFLSDDKLVQKKLAFKSKKKNRQFKRSLIYINHGLKPKNSKYFYTVGVKRTLKPTLLRQDAKAHAVFFKGLYAYSFFKGGCVEDLCTSKKALVLRHKQLLITKFEKDLRIFFKGKKLDKKEVRGYLFFNLPRSSHSPSQQSH